MNILNINSTENENSQIISKLFNSLNIKEYEPNTINFMNEFIKSYIKNVLKEEKKNMILAKREKITIEDVESAVNTNQNNMYKNRSKIHEMQFLGDRSLNKSENENGGMGVYSIKVYILSLMFLIIML